MPIVDGNYVSPEWKNNSRPAITAAEMQALTSTVEDQDIRINEIESETTATGNEVADTRVGYDSTVYDSAGDAVRKQISELHDGLARSLLLGDANAGELPDGTDFDSLITPGNYKITDASKTTGMNNCPVSTACRVSVMQLHTNYAVAQFVIPYSVRNRVLFRVLSFGTWREWTDLNPIPDTTLSTAGLPADAKATGDYVKTAIATAATSAAALANGTDFNDLKIPGNYRVSSVSAAQSMMNYPVTSSGRVVVMEINGNTSIAQFVIPVSVANRLLYRVFANDVWHDWVDIPRSPELDTTLSTAGKAADAKATGDAIGNAIENAVSGIKHGADGKVYADAGDSVRGQIAQLKNTIDAPFPQVRYNSGYTQLVFPDAFTHTNKINIYDCGNGQYMTNFNVKNSKNAIGKACYIAPFGNDNNTGAADSPWLTFAKAMAENCNTVYLSQGTYYLDKHFINNTELIFDNIICDTEAIIFLGQSAGKCINTFSNIYIKNGAYVEGLTFLGGRGLTVTSTNKPTFNRCKFLKSSKNGLNFTGTNVTMVDCEASYNADDGFNYHKDGDNAPTGVVEIGCRGYHNGTANAASDNGSTVHDNGRIIRLNCEYGHCNGGVVADQRSISYNFGVTAHSSTNNTAGEEQYNANFYALGNCDMWLYGCRGSGSRYHVSAVTGSTIHTDVAVAADKQYVDSTSSIAVIT